MERIEPARQAPPETLAGLAGLLRISGRRNLRGYLVVLSGLLMLADLYLIFMVAPTDSVLGHVQRVFYFHVPIALMSFLAFSLVFVASVVYLTRRDGRWDNLAQAAAEVGVVYPTWRSSTNTPPRWIPRT